MKIIRLKFDGDVDGFKFSVQEKEVTFNIVISGTLLQTWENSGLNKNKQEIAEEIGSILITRNIKNGMCLKLTTFDVSEHYKTAINELKTLKQLNNLVIDNY